MFSRILMVEFGEIPIMQAWIDDKNDFEACLRNYQIKWDVQYVSLNLASGLCCLNHTPFTFRYVTLLLTLRRNMETSTHDKHCMIPLICT